MRQLSEFQKREKYNAIMEDVSKIVKRRLYESSYDEDDYEYSDMSTSNYSDMTPAQKFNAAKKFFIDSNLFHTAESIGSVLFPYVSRRSDVNMGDLEGKIEISCVSDNSYYLMKLTNYKGCDLRSIRFQDIKNGMFCIVSNEYQKEDLLNITVLIPRSFNKEVINEIRAKYYKKRFGLNDRLNMSSPYKLVLKLVLNNLSFDEIMDEIDELKSNLNYLVAMSRNANK